MPAMAEHIERQTKQKDAIRTQLADCDEFISAQDLHRSLQDSGMHIGLATVYRQLNSLAESGAVDTIRLNGQQLFRLCGDDAHHHHMVCTDCGRTVEIESPGERCSGCVLTARGKTATVNELWPIRMGGVQCSAHALR